MIRKIFYISILLLFSGCIFLQRNVALEYNFSNETVERLKQLDSILSITFYHSDKVPDGFNDILNQQNDFLYLLNLNNEKKIKIMNVSVDKDDIDIINKLRNFGNYLITVNSVRENMSVMEKIVFCFVLEYKEKSILIIPPRNFKVFEKQLLNYLKK